MGGRQVASELWQRWGCELTRDLLSLRELRRLRERARVCALQELRVATDDGTGGGGSQESSLRPVSAPLDARRCGVVALAAFDPAARISFRVHGVASAPSSAEHVFLAPAQ